MLIKNIFNFPEYYVFFGKDIKFDNSVLLKPLFDSVEPMEYLRKIYIEDTELFYNIRDELYMRGGSIIPERKSNIFPLVEFNTTKAIVITEDTSRYKDINFAIIGLNNFINKFKVESDLFFNYIPIEGIQNLSKIHSVEIISEVFIRAGFKIVDIEDEKDIDTINGESEITKIFSDKIYRSFIKFCNEKGFKKISDLNIDNLKEFEQKKYIRKAVVFNIQKILEQISSEKNEVEYNLKKLISVLHNNPLRKTFEYIGEDYLSFINDVYAYDQGTFNDNEYTFNKGKELNEYLIKRIEKINIKKLNEKRNKIIDSFFEHENFKYIVNLKLTYLLETFSITSTEELDENFTIFDVLEDIRYLDISEKIYNNLPYLVNIKEKLEDYCELLPQRELVVLHERQSGTTLELIGSKLGITRERVRQIEKKTMNKLLMEMNNLYLPIFFRYYTEHDLIITLDELCQRIGITSPIQKSILKILVENEKEIHFLNELNLYILAEVYNKFKGKLEQVDFSRDIIKYDEIKTVTQTSKALENFVDIILNEKGYVKGKGLYIKENTKLLPRINYLFKYVIDEPLEMNDEGYKYFSDLMLEYFPINFESSKRAIIARISDAEETILVNSNTYFYHDKHSVDEDFLIEVEEILDMELRDKSYVDPRLIYDKYKDLFSANSIISHVHLYSIIQYYLSEKYEHGPGNTLYIYNNDTKIIDSEKILVQYLEKNNSEDERINILNNLNWTSVKLDQLIARIRSVIQISESKIKLVSSFRFEQEDINELKIFIEEQFKDGYAFTLNLLFNIPNKLRDKLKQQNLLKEYSLMAILKWINPQIRGFSKLLYLKGSKITSIEQVICREYPTFVTRNEIQQFVESYNYSEQTAFKVIRDLLDKRFFIQYSTTEYINCYELDFKSEVAQSLKLYLDANIGNKKYISTLNLIGFENKVLPIGVHGWTHHLIYEFAEFVGYRKIPTTSDYRYNKLVLVKGDSGIKSYEELVYFIVCNEYKGRNHEEDLAKYLESKKLTYNPKRLSNEIYESKYFNFDKFGFYTLKGE